MLRTRLLFCLLALRWLSAPEPAAAGTCRCAAGDIFAWNSLSDWPDPAAHCDGDQQATVDDSFLIGDGCAAAIESGTTLGEPLGVGSGPLTGDIVVEAGGTLEIRGKTELHHQGRLRYADGSDGRLEGGVVSSSRAVLFPEAGAEADAAGWERAVDAALTAAIEDLTAAVEG